MSVGIIFLLTNGSNLINFLKKSFCPAFFCRFLILFLNLIGIFGILTKPSVKALKYKPVPPTIIGILFFFLIIFIFSFVRFNHFPVEKFFLHFESHKDDD